MTFAWELDGFSWNNTHEMAIHGKRNAISKEDLLKLAISGDIEQGEKILGQVVEAAAHFRKFAQEEDLPKEFINRVEAILQTQEE